MSRLVLAIACLLMWVAPAVQAADAPNLKKYDGADRGHLLLTSSTAAGQTELRIRRLDGAAEVSFDISESKLKKPHFTEEAGTRPPRDIPEGMSEMKSKRRGFVYDIALPPGQYEVVSIRSDVAGYWRTDYYDLSKKTGFDGIQFEIKAGVITYLGRFTTVRLMVKGPFGYMTPHGALVSLTNDADKDMALATQQFPSLSPLISAGSVVSAVPTRP